MELEDGTNRIYKKIYSRYWKVDKQEIGTGHVHGT